MSLSSGASVLPRFLGAVWLITAAGFLSGCDDSNGGASATTPTASRTATAAHTATATSSVGGTATPTASPSGTAPTPGAGTEAYISDASIASDGTVKVTFALTDGSGTPITPVLGSTQDPMQGRVRFTLAHLEDYAAGGESGIKFDRYVNDVDKTRPKYDASGALQPVNAAAGVYLYTFKAKLAAGFDPGLTYSVGLQVDRTVEGRQQGVNRVFDFVPAGGTVRIREGATTEQCNSCHAPLLAHGNRREVRLCSLCHTEASVDEKGRSVDLRNMIHKIHMGKALPSVLNGESGASYAIYSSFQRQDVVFAHKDEHGRVEGVGFPRNIRDCNVCHAQGATARYHRERPAAAACASCHDDVNPSSGATAAGPPGTNHFLGRGFDDGDCAFCHTADVDKEFDASVAGAHVIPERSRQLAGLNVSIVGVANHAVGQSPQVTFKVADNQGVALRDLSGLNRLAFTISGPTSDYSVIVSTTAVGSGATGTLTGPAEDGTFSYVPTVVVPGNATGTWAIGAEARRTVQLVKETGGTISVNEAGRNQVVTFTVDESRALARRTVVEDARCGACHGEFSKDISVHGNLRNQIEYCVLCHNPNQSDGGRRRRDAEAVARGEETASIDFKVMIHKIHSGEELAQQPYLVYGFGAAPPQGTGYTIFDFGEVRFPGDRRNCETCHASGTYLVPPFPGSALDTRVARLDPESGTEVEVGRTSPVAAVCSSCHDADESLAHIETMIASDGEEACVVCHAEGRPFPVSELHAESR